MKTGTKRALYVGLAVVVGIVCYCFLQSPRESLTSLFLSENTRLFIAVADGDNENAIAILEKSPELVKNARHHNDYTLLHQAAVCGNAQMVKYLLEKGSDYDARTAEGETALQLAENKRSGMEAAPSTGWSLARDGDMDAVVDLLSHNHVVAVFYQIGLSFEYPPDWQLYSQDHVAMMKQYLEKELRPYGRTLLEFAVIHTPNDEVSLLVSKYSMRKPMKPSEFIEERNQVYEMAKRSGDVTKVNYVKETTVANLPAVEEDVERSNGGRGRTLKIINETTVFEISFIVNDAAKFPQYSEALSHLVSSINIVEQ